MEKSEMTRNYKCDYYSVWAHPRSCFFCDHCTDIFFDYTNGPYMWMCELTEDGEDASERVHLGMTGQCTDFME